MDPRRPENKVSPGEADGGGGKGRAPGGGEIIACGGGGGTHLLLALSHLTIDHPSLSRRGTVPTLTKTPPPTGAHFVYSKYRP